MERTTARTADEAISGHEVKGRDSMAAYGMPSMERLDASAFSGTTLNRPGTWAIAFLADWCGYCREFAPEFASLGSEHVHLAVGDVSQYSSPLWDLFGVEVVPTVIVFRDGRPVHRFDGRPSEGLGAEDVERLRRLLANGSTGRSATLIR